MKELFGYTKDGREVYRITLKDKGGNSVALISYGAVIQSLVFRNVDVVLGYDTVGEYESQNGCLGAVIGRCANRIGGGRFVLDGRIIELSKNKATYQIHGGFEGFGNKIWDFEECENSVIFSLFSPDTDEGYPGNLEACVRYTFTDGVLDVVYDAFADKKTVINLTNHSYFNLDGCGNILDHTLFLDCDRVAWSDSYSIPDGRLFDVRDSVFDFLTPKKIGRDFNSTEDLFASKKGYDHNFIVRDGGKFKKVGLLSSEKTGISMEISTDMPDVVVYTANTLGKRPGKGKSEIGQYSGICFETQYMTNAVNLEGFAKPVFDAGEHFRQHTCFRFL